MKWHILSRLALGLVAVLTVMACAPKPTPVTATAPAAMPTVIATKSATVNPEEAAWAKVIEAAKNEGELTIYSYWPTDTSLSLQRAFKDRFGIGLNVITGQGATFLERLETEKRMGKMEGDALFNAPAYVLRAREIGLTLPLTELPVLKEKGVWVLDPDEMFPDKQFVYTALISYPSAINTKLISPTEAPRSYDDLLSTAWKGKMIVTSPVANSAMYSMFVPLLNRGIINMDFIRDLGKQEMSLQPSSPTSLNALARGEKPFLITAPTTSVNPVVAGGAPIRTIVMEEGTTVQLSGGGAAIKGSPHPNAAKLFINWILTKEGQDTFGQAQAQNPLRKDVQDYTPEAARFVAKKLISTNSADLEQAGKMFNDRIFPKLWGQ